MSNIAALTQSKCCVLINLSPISPEPADQFCTLVHLIVFETKINQQGVTFNRELR